MNSNEIIDLLGGTKVVAEIFDISPPSVCSWRKYGIPQDKLMYLGATLEKETKGKLNRKQMFPKNWKIIWPELIDK